MCKGYDLKECFLIRFYCEKLRNHTFDETDLYSFLILVRPHVNTKSHKYIADFANLIAHRKRDRGVAFDAVSGAIKHDYNEVHVEGQKVIEGFRGIETAKWHSEWKDLGEEFGFAFDDRTINEITLCMFSILQFTKYEKKVKFQNNEKTVRATIFLLQSDDGQLSAATLEDGKECPFIIFFLMRNLNFAKLYPSRLIKDPVIAIRTPDGILILQNGKGERIV